jgi:hypothetical protein
MLLHCLQVLAAADSSSRNPLHVRVVITELSAEFKRGDSCSHSNSSQVQHDHSAKARRDRQLGNPNRLLRPVAFPVKRLALLQVQAKYRLARINHIEAASQLSWRRERLEPYNEVDRGEDFRQQREQSLTGIRRAGSGIDPERDSRPGNCLKRLLVWRAPSDRIQVGNVDFLRREPPDECPRNVTRISSIDQVTLNRPVKISLTGNTPHDKAIFQIDDGNDPQGRKRRVDVGCL